MAWPPWLARPVRRLGHAFARQHLGLGVSTERVSAVLLRRGRVTWSAFQMRDATMPLGESVGALLAQVPRRRWPRPVVTAAVGAAAAQVKRITGLPDPRGATDLAALVRDRTPQLFLVNGVPLYSSSVRRVAPDTGWAAAIEAPVVLDITRACRAARLRCCAVVPTAVALEQAVESKRVAMVDGAVREEITFADGAIGTLRRMACDDANRGPSALEVPPLVPALQALGDVRWSVADAFGAACVPLREPLVVAAHGVTPGESPARGGLLRAAIACALATIIALVLPPMIAARQGRSAQHTTTQLAPRARTARRDARALMQVTARLAAVGAFERSRQSATRLLGDLTRALPDGAALAEFQLDSAGTGSVVAYAARAADVVDAVERVPGLTGPAIVGPVTQELVAGHSLERVTVRFVVVPPSQRPDAEGAP